MSKQFLRCYIGLVAGVASDLEHWLLGIWSYMATQRCRFMCISFVYIAVLGVGDMQHSGHEEDADGAKFGFLPFCFMVSVIHRSQHI